MPDKNIRNLDIYVPIFDFILDEKLDTITAEQVERLPNELRHKVIKYGKGVIGKLRHHEKWLILSICFNKVICTVILDEDKGLSKEDINEAILAQAGKIKNDKLLDDMYVNSIGVQGDKEVMQAIGYINHTQFSEIFNLFRAAHPREKSKAEIKRENWSKARNRIVSVFRHYESVKRKVLESNDLSIHKLYALLFFYEGEKRGREFYSSAFENAFSKNKGDLSVALAEMVRSGYMIGRGDRNHVRYSLSAKGSELADRLFDKLIYSY